MSFGHGVYDDSPAHFSELRRIKQQHPELQEFLDGDFSVSHKWDIPWVAGRNLSLSRVYIDRRVKIIRLLRRTNARGNINVNVVPFLMEHELVEGWLMDKLKFEYEHAHHIATAAEMNAVDSAGILWDSYEKEMRKDIKTDEDPRIERCPPDYDTLPIEEAGSPRLLKRVLDCMGRQRKTARGLFQR